MLWSIEKLWMSDTVKLSILIEFLGSLEDVSSTNLNLRCQSAKRLFVIIVKSITPIVKFPEAHLPWGISNLIMLHLFLQLAVCLLKTQQSNWWAQDQPLVFATRSLRCYDQLDQSLSKSWRRRSGLLDHHSLLPRKWLVTWIKEYLPVVEWPLRANCRGSIFPLVTCESLHNFRQCARERYWAEIARLWVNIEIKLFDSSTGWREGEKIDCREGARKIRILKRKSLAGAWGEAILPSSTVS